jgi:hypothetical protein
MTGPNEEDAVPDGGSQDEATSGETPVDGEAGEAHVGKGGMEPTGLTLSQEEERDIEEQVAAITLTNKSRPSGEQISLRPEDVN